MSSVAYSQTSSSNTVTSQANLTKPQQRLLQSSFCSCTKFVPQAFNTNKCQQCFYIKDLNTIEALSEYSKVRNFISFIYFFFFSFNFNRRKIIIATIY